MSVSLGGARILNGIDLEVPAGGWLGLVGPNGAGKTTLVRTLTGSVDHEGAVTIGDTSAASGGARERARRVAVVPQHPVVPEGITVFEYVLLGRAPHQGLRFSPSASDRRMSFAVLQRLSLDELADRTVSTLSGGERRQVVIARALAQDTPVIVLDEPTAFLDAGHQLDVLELIDDLRSDHGLTVITTLHDLTLAGQFADRLAVLSQGEIVAVGEPKDVLTRGLIGRHWGVEADVTISDNGSVSVAIRRRTEQPLDDLGHRRPLERS